MFTHGTVTQVKIENSDSKSKGRKSEWALVMNENRLKCRALQLKLYFHFRLLCKDSNLNAILPAM